MVYTDETIVKIASQILKIESEENTTDIKLKTGIDAAELEQTLIQIGIPKKNFVTGLLQFSQWHSDYDLSIISRGAGAKTEISNFFEELGRQKKRLDALDVLYFNGGMPVSDAENAYIKSLGMRETQAVLAARRLRVQISDDGLKRLADIINRNVIR